MNSTHRVGPIALRLVALAALAALAACGSGGDGAADLGEGGSAPQELPVTTSVDFEGSGEAPFTLGDPPFTAQFSGASVVDGTWIIPDGATGVVDFSTPADRVAFEAIANYGAAAAAAAQKPSSVSQPSQVVNEPFTVPMYVRGTLCGNFDVCPENLLVETADNVLEVTLTLDAADYRFKVADAGWTGPTNCGADTEPQPVSVGTPFTMQCDALSQDLNLTIPSTGDYKFTFNVSDVDAPTILVAEDTGNGGGNGGGEPEPEGMKITFLAPDGTPIVEPIESKTTTAAELQRRGGETRIARVTVENIGNIGDIGIEDFEWTADPRLTPEPELVDLVYRRLDGDYSNTSIAIDGQTYNCVAAAGAVGCVAAGVPVLPYSRVDIVVNSNGVTENITAYSGGVAGDIYAFSGAPIARVGTPAGLPASADEVILYYKRPGAQTDATYAGWGLHLFPTDPAGPSWTVFTGGEFPYEGIDPEWGAYFRIALPGNESPTYSNNPEPLDTFPNVLGFIIHRGDQKDPGPDQFIRIAEDGNLLFVVSGVNEVSPLPPGGGTIARIIGASAHWVDEDTILLADSNFASAASFELLYSADASITAGIGGISGGFETFPLTSGTNPALPNMLHLDDAPALALPGAAADRADELLRGQLVVLARNASGTVIGGTLVQTAGALDALYAGAAYDAPLGVSYAGGTPAVSLWAPTALLDPGVTLNVYNEDGTPFATVAMDYDATTGIWSATGTSDWDRKYYTFSLRVYSYATNSIVTNEVTDPYSVSLAADSVRSQFVNLDDADTQPAGWDSVVKPAIEAPEDIVIYELHVRDFSAADTTVPEAAQGKYTAFSAATGLTAGRQHLRGLADAGLTHVHLLPAFDIATVRERRENRVELDDPVEDLCTANPDAEAAGLCTTDAGKTIRQAIEDALAADQIERPQQIATWMRNLDGFNWGYDPYHYGVPEGSYATDPDGITRIREFREMVVGLADLGLGTIMDVVYNHTNASGQNPRSVLDKIVPGYYHRRGATDGNVLRNSCCDDTAAEFRMMEKLMIDTAEIWARDYKIDGFRFDLMSFHPLESMLRLKERMEAVNPDFYVYGEAWNFGDIQNDTRFVQARQANMAGSLIGSFSDRIRDPIRGGGPFDSGAAHIANQGFISGWYYDPNAVNDGSADEREALIEDTDNIRVWLAGGLEDYEFTNSVGETVIGSEVDYRGQESGYTADPQEAINYIDKHDNETLWDISQYKHPVNTPTADRVRAHNVGYSLILLGQGIPFIHAGGDILRSKSLDRNSYDSGDWFNELLWDLSDTKWNKGLPLQSENNGSYPQIEETSQIVNADPGPADLQRANDHIREMLEIRSGSPLFRLRTGEQVRDRVRFLNTGPSQIAGVVAMEIDGCTEPDLNASEAAVLSIFNASDEEQTLELYTDQTWALHPVLVASTDPIVQTATHDVDGFSVPARTTAVFIRTAPAQVSCAPFVAELFVRGSFNGWVDPPDPAYKLEFLGGPNYVVSAPVAAGTQAFKVADAGYTPETNCGGASAGQVVELGVPTQISCFGQSADLTFDAPGTGDYTFALDASNLTNPTLTVTRTPPFAVDLFIRGDVNGWADPPPESARMTLDAAGMYRVVLSGLAAQTYNFKVADAGYGASNGGASNCGSGAETTATVGAPFPLNCASNSGNIGITLPAAGSYLFLADFSTAASPVVTVSRATFDVDIFVRGEFNGWVDPPPPETAFSDQGGGILKANIALTAGDTAFKVADATWNVFNCGGGTVTVAQPTALTCGSESPNTAFTVPATGSYTFTLDANNQAAPTVTVTGP